MNNRLAVDSTINYDSEGKKTVNVSLGRPGFDPFPIEKEEIPVLIEILKDYQKTVK